MSKVAVIGAGPMGLACAYELLKLGHAVDVYEADDRVGGMTAHFDFNGLSIERYYHFICKPDKPLFDLLEELDLSAKLRWHETKMGYFYNGKLYEWGNPFALLKFSPLSLLDRLRYGLHMFYCTRIKDWSGLDKQEASQWIIKWEGQRAYNTLWKKLFELKFHHFTGNLSASWIWARIRRVGQSRKSIFTEQMGYLEGGSETLLKAFETAIKKAGGQINLSSQVERVLTDNGRVKGINVDGDFKSYDNVVITIPLPFVSSMIPDLPENIHSIYKNINNIGVVCVLLKLKKPVTSALSLAEMLKTRFSLMSQDEAQSLSLIRRSLRRMYEMINKILDIKAIDAEKMNIELEAVNVQQVLNYLIDMFRNKANQKNIQVVAHIDELYALVDRNFFIQIIENLLSNALKFSDRNKIIYIRAVDSFDHCRIEIEDQGPGIGQSDLSHLFTENQSLPAQPTDGESSNGLGLSIVKKFVDVMGGKVWCESQVGKGSVFIVEFEKALIIA